MAANPDEVWFYEQFTDFEGFFEVILIFLVVVSNSFHFFTPVWGKFPFSLYNIFQMG